MQHALIFRAQQLRPAISHIDRRPLLCTFAPASVPRNLYQHSEPFITQHRLPRAQTDHCSAKGHTPLRHSEGNEKRNRPRSETWQPLYSFVQRPIIDREQRHPITAIVLRCNLCVLRRNTGEIRYRFSPIISSEVIPLGMASRASFRQLKNLTILAQNVRI